MRRKIVALLIALCLLSSAACAEGFIRVETQSLLPLSKGDAGAVVERVQARLVRLGFLSGLPDGEYGTRTAEAVKLAQRHLSAVRGAPNSEDGKVDELMYALLKEGFPAYRRSLKEGDSNADVRRLQNRLLFLGYLDVVSGSFGSATRQAVLAFQARNAIEQTGVAGVKTQEALFGPVPVEAREPIHPYIAYVSIAQQRTYIYGFGEGGYTRLEKTMVCSTGLDQTPTITGTFKTQGQAGAWYYFGAFDVWARYALRIRGPYLFHSTLFYDRSEATANPVSIRVLGRKASHGCIRLAVDDARWLYEHTDKGFTTIIY